MKTAVIAMLTLTASVWLGAAQAGEVARAVVTTSVENREPINDLERVQEGTDKIYFFTELRGMEGQTIKHRWSHNNEVMAEVEFAVGGPRWRVWSSKNLMPDWGGTWQLAVIDAAGEVVSDKSVVIVTAEGGAVAAPVAAEPAAAAEQPAAAEPAAEPAAAEKPAE